MKNYFMEFKRFFNISSTKNKICRLNLCNALKSRINFKTIEWQLNTVMFCSRQHILCSYRSSKYKQEHGCNRSCSQSWERKAMDLPPVFWYRYHIWYQLPVWPIFLEFAKKFFFLSCFSTEKNSFPVQTRVPGCNRR